MTVTIDLDDLKDDITVIFHQIVANKIKRGDKGRALFLYKNTNLTGDYAINTYKSAVITLEDAALEKYIKQIMKRGAKSVTVLEYKSTVASVKDVMDDNLPNFDWIMSVDSDAQSAIATYAKENKKFACVYNIQADSIYVVSVINPSAVLINDNGTTSTITGLQLVPIIGGACCGCPYNRSISSYVFDELKSVTQPETYVLGQITLYPEEEGIRIANPVNTLQTLDTTHTEDMKSLTIAEGMYRLDNDIVKAFRTGYKGKYKNHYDNQCLFYAACNYGYLNELESTGIEILDPNYDNKIYTDVEAQRNAWLATGKSEAADWSDDEVRKNTYKKSIYATLDVKFLDAMEAMKVTVEMF